MAGTDLAFGDLLVTEEDERNWTVRRKTGRISEKTGEEIVQFLGYYGDLEHACRRVLRERMRGHGATDAANIITAIERAYAEIKEAL